MIQCAVVTELFERLWVQEKEDLIQPQGFEKAKIFLDESISLKILKGYVMAEKPCQKEQSRQREQHKKKAPENNLFMKYTTYY